MLSAAMILTFLHAVLEAGGALIAAAVLLLGLLWWEMRDLGDDGEPRE
jgi:hypothetical protein